jgi:hypothetical protein
MRFVCLLLVGLALFIGALPAHADPLPGDACPAAGRIMQTGGAESAEAGSLLVCRDDTWQPILSYNGDGDVTVIGNQTCATGEFLKFDGTKWICGTAGGGGDDICGDAGGLCADGTIYAGVSLDGRVPFYAMPDDAPSTYTWGPAGTDTALVNCTTAPGTQDSCWTGEANTDTLALLGSSYAAATYCADLTDYGHDDWYLPSQYELAVLYGNRDSLGGFQNAYYWSSSENASLNAYARTFSNGTQSNVSKTNTYRVRCVRR